MELINEFITMYNSNVVLMVATSIFIWIIIKLLSPKISYIILKILKRKEIKEDGFYKPLSGLISFGGLYLAIIILRTPLNFSPVVIGIINKVSKIIVTILLAKGLADGLTTNSEMFKKVAKKTSKKMDNASINYLIKAIRGIIYVIAGFIVILELGYDLSGLVAGLGIGSLVITLAAQDTAKSLLGGLMIALDKPFKIGDWISIPSCEGTVEEITFRSTRIRNSDNCIVNVPNSTMMQSIITNSSKIKTRRFEAKLIVKSDTSLEKVKIFEETILSMMEENQYVINPTLTVHFDKITGGGFEILINGFTKTSDYIEFIVLKEELNYEIMNIVNSQNITLV